MGFIMKFTMGHIYIYNIISIFVYIYICVFHDDCSFQEPLVFFIVVFVHMVFQRSGAVNYVVFVHRNMKVSILNHSMM